jgi:aspartyl-tRNA(Asn)/glutamyl-tRNA(Gln) amidotransferase subunit A
LSESELEYLSIGEAAAMVAAREVSPVELTEAALRRIDRYNPHGKFFVTVDTEGALKAARVAEAEILKSGPRSKLHGLPVSLKDNFKTAGMRTTAGSLILRDSVPAKNSEVARRLKDAGAVLLGKTNMHEFAYGITSENPHYGDVRNPWNLARISGGSSGGSAASVAAGMGFGSVGTDTGGSIRVPSSFCGVVGLKPTFGRVSVEGTIPLAKSFDHAGPIGRRVGDVSAMLNVIAGSHLETSSEGKVFRIGWPSNYYFDFLDDEVKLLLEQAAKCFKGLGVGVQEVKLPTLQEAMEVATRMSMAESTAWHEARGYYPQRQSMYGEDVRGRLAMGRDVSAVEYLRGFEVKEKLMGEFDRVFANVDAILTPATPAGAPVIGKTEIAIAGKTETLRTAIMRLNRPTNFTGHPSITVPCGFTSEGMPVGLQLIGAWWSEAKLLALAEMYEGANDWWKRRPKLG